MEASKGNPEPSEDQAEALLDTYQDSLKSGDAGAIENAALAFVSFACESHAAEKPNPFYLLSEEATRFEDRGEWERAERAYLESIAIAQDQKSPMREFKAHSDLSGLYSFIGQKQHALESAEAALDAARHSGIEPLLGMAFQDVASCYLNLDKPEVALETADELLATLPEEQLYEPYKSDALLTRGLCNVRLHNLPQAEEDLQAAMALLAPTAGIRMLAGTQSRIGRWWAAQAELKIQQNDFAGAVEARSKAVEFRRVVAAAPQLEGPYKFASLATSLRKLGEALLAVNDIRGAEAAFAESLDIQRHFHLPPGE